MMDTTLLLIIILGAGYTQGQALGQALGLGSNNLRISADSEDVRIHVGSSGKLECTASSWNPLAQLIWKRRSSGGQWEVLANHGVVSLQFQSRFDVTMSVNMSPPSLTSTLSLSNTTYDDMGQYKCEATVSGRTQASILVNVTIYENGTNEVLPIKKLKMTNPYYDGRHYGRRSNLKTGVQLQWNRPESTGNEHWFYTVHLEYVFNRLKTTKLHKVPKSYGTSSSVSLRVNGLEPCTVFKTWISGYSQKYQTGSRRRHDYYRSSYYRYNRGYQPPKLLPGVYRRAQSQPITFMTRKSVPMEVPKLENIEYSARTPSKDNCTITVSYQAENEPFGCPTLGFYFNVSTPETWPASRVQTAVGASTSLSGLAGGMTYPASITLYNKFGAGADSHTFFITCQAAPVRQLPEHNQGNA